MFTSIKPSPGGFFQPIYIFFISVVSYALCHMSIIHVKRRRYVELLRLVLVDMNNLQYYLVIFAGEGKALYIDTEGTFRPERLVDIATRYNIVIL